MRYATSSIPGCDPFKQQAARLRATERAFFVGLPQGHKPPRVGDPT